MSTTTATNALKAFIDRLNVQDLPAFPGLDEWRSDARMRLDQLDFPTTRDEAWKYTRLGRISRETWNVVAPQEGIELEGLTIPDWPGYLAVFVNGFFQPQLSSPELPFHDQLHIISESTAYEGADVSDMPLFPALNAGFCTGGLILMLDQNETLDQPLHVLHIVQGEQVLAQPRFLFLLGESAQADVVVTFHATPDSSGFTNAVIEAEVGANASFNVEVLEDEGDDHFLVTSKTIEQARDSRFGIRTITASGALVRNTLEIGVDGTGCDTHLFGTYSPRGKEHVDNATVVDHRVPNCQSNELYKGIIYDQATGVFNGKVFVREDAQHTNAFQQNNNILMSETASMNSKPELEIYADDVQCSHGSTTGQIDEEAVFYLKARGLSDQSARDMLVEAFRSEVLEGIARDDVRAHFTTFLR